MLKTVKKSKYIANGIRALFQPLSIIFIEKNPEISAVINADDNIIQSTELKSSPPNSNTVPPIITGIDIKNDNSADSSGE